MISGKSIIGFETSNADGVQFTAFNPETGRPLEPMFISATLDDANRAARLAEAAASDWRHSSGALRAKFLRAVATEIEGMAEAIIARANLETALPVPRLQGELARTCNQIRLFANLVEEGSWVMARIDRGDPKRTPTPKPDIRSLLRPLGPVVIFGASNFPLAFSVAGGDSVSAWAAGNPVVVKAHPAHPGTSELVGQAISKSVQSCNLPEGLFSLLFDAGTSIGQALVKHPLVKAVGFTGSFAGGRALMNLAAAREEPIPVFAEMGSLNPVFILPRALQQRGEQIVSGLYGSFTLGGGQFCTKPGVVFLPRGEAARNFRQNLESMVKKSEPFCLLTSGIRNNFVRGSAERSRNGALAAAGVENLPSNSDGPFAAASALMQAEAEAFLAVPELSEELFGPTTLLVTHSGREQMLEIALRLKGHLTATLHGTDDDFAEFKELIAVLATRVGRVIFNGYPTGVEVSHAMVHGGPYPATSDGRSTSVGTQAIFRFSRPVCFQDCPNELLPAELQDENPLGIWRLQDGEMTRQAMSRRA